MTKQQVVKVLKGMQGTNLQLGDDRTTRWLATNLSKIKTTMNQRNFIDSGKTVIRKSLTPGKMVFYGYSPKTNFQLPLSFTPKKMDFLVSICTIYPRQEEQIF